jgi:hypothetical protein
VKCAVIATTRLSVLSVSNNVPLDSVAQVMSANHQREHPTSGHRRGAADGGRITP